MLKDELFLIYPCTCLVLMHLMNEKDERKVNFFCSQYRREIVLPFKCRRNLEVSYRRILMVKQLIRPGVGTGVVQICWVMFALSQTQGTLSTEDKALYTILVTVTKAVRPSTTFKVQYLYSVRGTTQV